MKKEKLIAILIFLSVILLIPIQTLEVRKVGTEEIGYHQQVKVNDEFSVNWIHSVSLQPVTETYSLDAPERIALVRMEFNDFGPNLPSQPEFDQEWIFKDGKIIVINYDKVFERVPVTIGTVISDHMLIYHDKKVKLKDKFSPGASVNIGFVEKSILKYIIDDIQIFLNK